MSNPTLTIRMTIAFDARNADLLVAFHRHSRPRSRTLIAERDGVPVPAIALTSGSIAADPTLSAGDTGRLLRSWRYRLLRQGGAVSPARLLPRTVR
jgi:hypothetical protein